MTGRMAGSLQELQRAVVEQIEIVFQLQDVKLANIAIVVLAVYRARPLVRPQGITNLVPLNDVHSIGKIAHATCMIEMKVRVDDIAHVTSSKSQLLKLSVHYVLARKGARWRSDLNANVSQNVSQT